jgi:hypothetical protein
MPRTEPWTIRPTATRPSPIPMRCRLSSTSRWLATLMIVPRSSRVRMLLPTSYGSRPSVSRCSTGGREVESCGAGIGGTATSGRGPPITRGLAERPTVVTSVSPCIRSMPMRTVDGLITIHRLSVSRSGVPSVVHSRRLSCGRSNAATLASKSCSSPCSAAWAAPITLSVTSMLRKVTLQRSRLGSPSGVTMALVRGRRVQPLVSCTVVSMVRRARGGASSSSHAPLSSGRIGGLYHARTR